MPTTHQINLLAFPASPVTSKGMTSESTELGTHPRLVNQLLSNPDFQVDDASLGYVVRDIVNMNWWNTAGVLTGYRNNKRVQRPFTEDQKRVAVQLKEYYRVRIVALKDEQKFRHEIRGYLGGTLSALRQLSMHSQETRANPSQYFHKPDGTMTWVDCTSRATYAAKYVFQNGYIDYDGVCRVLGASDIIKRIDAGACQDLGIRNLFEDGLNSVKAEIFSQKESQLTVAEWVEQLGIFISSKRRWLFEAVKHVRTDPYKIYEAGMVAKGLAPGLNECLYGFHTSASVKGASRASHASAASNASSASDAGTTAFLGLSWDACETAITKPKGLVYPKEFRANIFAIAGNWKINSDIVNLGKSWFDPFSGHGTSPLYAKRYGINYLGFDTNAKAFREYLGIIQEEIDAHPLGAVARVENKDSTVFYPELVGKFDLCYTSPPYFNFEEYGGNRGHYEDCGTYDDFHEKISIPVFRNVHRYLIRDGILALQSEKDKRHKDAWKRVIESVGFECIEDTVTGQEAEKYSKMSKRDQSLLIFKKHLIPADDVSNPLAPA